MTSAADYFVKRFDVIDGVGELGDAFEELHAMGATWIRATPLPGFSTGYVLEGWRDVPGQGGL